MKKSTAFVLYAEVMAFSFLVASLYYNQEHQGYATVGFLLLLAMIFLISRADQTPPTHQTEWQILGHLRADDYLVVILENRITREIKVCHTCLGRQKMPTPEDELIECIHDNDLNSL